MSEVRCTHCRGTYDLGDVEITARYADATVFKVPCCGQMVDDRTWKSRPDFQRVDARTERERAYAKALQTGDVDPGWF